LHNHFSKAKSELEADLEAEALTFCWKQKHRKRLGWKRKRLKFECFRITGLPDRGSVHKILKNMKKLKKIII
jgi:hypothetical protein